MTVEKWTSTEWLGRLCACALSLIVISVIAFFVLDEANARFGVMAASVLNVALTSLLAKGHFGFWGLAFDFTLIRAFIYYAI